MTPDPDAPTGPILSAAPILSAHEAKKRFFFYLLLKLAGLGALFGGVLLARGGVNVGNALLLAFGCASLFVRPHMLGLTTRPEK